MKENTRKIAAATTTTTAAKGKTKLRGQVEKWKIKEAIKVRESDEAAEKKGITSLTTKGKEAKLVEILEMRETKETKR